jgi:hypothetical protein
MNRRIGFMGFALKNLLMLLSLVVLAGVLAIPASADVITSDILMVGTQTISIPAGATEGANTVSLLTAFGTIVAHTAIGLIEHNSGAISDNIEIVGNGQILTVTLTSDTDTTSVPLITEFNIQEDGSTALFPRDVNGFIDLTAGFNFITGLTNLPTIKVFSDFEDAVPEPSAKILVGSVLLLGVIVALRRKSLN